LIARLLTLVALSTVAACGSVPFPSYSPIEDPSLSTRLLAAFPGDRLPRQQVQRASYRFATGEVLLTQYLVFEPPAALRVAAVSDLGGTVFSVEHGDGGTTVLQASPGFPEDLLLEQLVPDLLVALARPDGEECQAVRLQDGRDALHYRLGESEVLLRESVGEVEVLRLVRGRDGASCSIIDFAPADVERDRPAFLQVVNTAAPYEVVLEVSPWTEAGG